MPGKRLLVICQGFPPFHGGAEQTAWYLAREAVRDGWAVEVLTSDIGGRLPPEQYLDGMAVHRVHAAKKEWSAHTIPELLAFYQAGRRWMNQDDSRPPDHTLAHFTYPAGLLARRLHQRRGTPYTVVMQGSDVPGHHPERFGRVDPLLKPIARRVWRKAHGVIAVSRNLADLARQTWPKGRITVVGNGVDTTLFHPPDERVRVSGAPDAVRLITVAQCIRRKGLHHLARALGELPKPAHNSLRLEVYGTGPEQTRLRRQFEQAGLSAAFRGIATREALAAAYREADLFVLPSLAEGSPLAVLEAMACGLPVLVTSVGDLPHLVEDQRNGLLVPAGDVSALKAALWKLLEDPDQRLRLGRAARKTAEGFTWPVVWQRYRQCMEGDRKIGANA